MNNKPPKIAENILKFFLPRMEREFLIGDYEFLFEELISNKGKFYAYSWYWIQLFKAIPVYLINRIYWGVVMLKNYFKIAFRNLRKQTTYSLINLLGLSLGMASCIIISLWIINQLSYDKFHNKSENIAQVLMQGNTPDYPATPWPLAVVLKDEFPEIEKATRFDYFTETLVKYENKLFYENNIRVVDKDFFEIFSFPLLRGNSNNLFDNIYATVISESIAKKYFGDEDPLGKELSFNDEYGMTVTGVIEDIPLNSSLQFDILIPVDFMIATNRSGFEMSWGWWSPGVFLKLNPNSIFGEVNKKIENILIDKKIEKEPPRISIIPFEESYMFFSGRMNEIYIFSAVAFLIIFIAGINFINLSTARSSKRAKEIGVRQVSGAFRSNLITQFLVETTVLAFFALLISWVIVYLSLPFLNSWFNTRLEISFEIINQISFISVILTLLTGLIAGIYPAFVLSSMRPVNVLKGELKSGRKGSWLRSFLVTLQFSLSIILIISTGVISNQLEYFLQSDLGYNKDNLLVLSLKGESKKNYSVFKKQLLNQTDIIGVTGSSSELPFFSWSSSTCEWSGKDPNLNIITYNNFIDYDFFQTFEIDLLNGRTYSPEHQLDTGWVFIINKEMQRIMETDNAVGKRLTYWGNEGEIIGVTNDFYVQSLYNRLNPLVLMLRPDEVNTAYVRITSHNVMQTLSTIENVWNETNPGYPFEYSFIDKRIEARYNNLESLANLINSFAFIAIFTACLGLFGLSSFTAEQKTKEIGIRKVHGASVNNILFLLIKKFIPEIIIANLFAWPSAYILMSFWLENFVYRADLEAGLFIISGLITLIIVLITVISQVQKAARLNPVESLRYE